MKIQFFTVKSLTTIITVLNKFDIGDKMKKYKWYIFLSTALIGMSTAIYVTQIMVFHKENDTFFYMLQDLSFVPINVLIVTFIIDKLLQKKEKESLINKLNMVIGLFFSEVGLSLISYFIKAHDYTIYNTKLHISPQWDNKHFSKIIKEMKRQDYLFHVDMSFLEEIKSFLLARRDILIQLMGNPNLLEHASFTDMLLAVFHLCDELGHRDAMHTLPSTDIEHLKTDMKRAYSQLLVEWLAYMNHLKKDYPYLFSISVRLNPFKEEQSIVVS